MEREEYIELYWWRVNLLYAWETSHKEFLFRYKMRFNEVYKSQNLPSVEQITREDRLVIAFDQWLAYFQKWKFVSLLVENKINPKNYYPEWWKKWDPIPWETINKILAAKLGSPLDMFKVLTWIKDDEEFWINNYSWVENEENISRVKDSFTTSNFLMAKARLFECSDSNTEITFYMDWRIWVYWSWCDCKPERIWDTFVSYTIPAEEVEKLVNEIIEANPGIVWKVNFDDWKKNIIEESWWNDSNRFIFSLFYLAFNEIDSYWRLYKFICDHWVKYEDFSDGW